MKNSLEKKLYKNLIISILIIIISIAVSIAILAGIVTQLTQLKKGKTDVAIKIHNIALSEKLRESYLKDIYLSYGNSKRFNAYLKLYNNEKNIQNILLRKIEKKISSMDPKDGKIMGDLYINLYNILSKHYKIEKEIISYLKTGDKKSAAKTFKLTYKESDKNFEQAITAFYNTIKNQANFIENMAKGKLTFILILNILAFFTFLLVTIKVSSKISKNITYLHKSVANIKNGKYETEILIETDDELGELATALDRMRQSYLKSLKLLKRNK